MSCSEEKAVDGLDAQVNKEADAELEGLRKENSKLKFRRDVLLRNIDELTVSAKNKSPMELDPLLYPKDGDKSYENCGYCGQNAMGLMTNIAGYLKVIFNEAISAAFPDATPECLPAVVMPSKKELAYQVNSAMKIGNVLKSKGQSISPAQVAQQLIAHVPGNTLILSMDVAGPGFINVVLNPGFLSREICNFLINGIRVQDEKKDKVVIDYSSPNIAKEMHVGHLRSTVIGDCLANILEFVGHEVIRVNHVGDWGTQFGMLLAHFMEKYPDYLTSPPSISDLQSFYREAKKRFDEEEDFKKRAYAAVVQLQSKDSKMIEAWKSICDISRKEFQSVYDRLGVRALREMGESFYHDLMKEVVKDLETRRFLIEEDGRKVFFPSEESKKLFFPSDKSASTKEENVPLTIVKSDGGFTYDSSDLTCIRYRIQEMGGSRIIYVIDNGQALHMHTIFACAKDCGYLDPEKVRAEHVGFGVVLGEDKKKFKTRSGDTVRLKDLLDEGLERARSKLREKKREGVLSSGELKEAEEAVAFGCIKYADLKQDRNRDYVFSFDRMLDDRGNTAVYLLYQLTRIRSIKRNANLQTETYKLAMEREDVKLEHPKEIKLANYLVRFPEIICQVASDLFPHTLCAFLYELSGVFSEFYDQCYCIEKITGDDGSVQQKVDVDRILLCEATASIMEEGFNLLGIKTVSKM